MGFKVGDQVRFIAPTSTQPRGTGVVVEVNPTHTPFSMGCTFDYYAEFPEYPPDIRGCYVDKDEIVLDT